MLYYSYQTKMQKTRNEGNMNHKNPPFEITAQILSYVTDIAELIGRISGAGRLSASPELRRVNRIKTIHGSLAIEQNTLSIEQITAVLNGKRVIAPPKDIAEVKNAYEIYEHLDELDPYSLDSLLFAHGIMTRGLVDESGVFRSRLSELLTAAEECFTSELCRIMLRTLLKVFLNGQRKAICQCSSKAASFTMSLS